MLRDVSDIDSFITQESAANQHPGDSQQRRQEVGYQEAGLVWRQECSR